MSDDVRRAAEFIAAGKFYVEARGCRVIYDGNHRNEAAGNLLKKLAQAYLAQQRADETEGGYAGWTIVAEGEDGSLLLQSKAGARRRIWPPHKADDDEPVTEEKKRHAPPTT